MGVDPNEYDVGELRAIAGVGDARASDGTEASGVDETGPSDADAGEATDEGWESAPWVPVPAADDHNGDETETRTPTTPTDASAARANAASDTGTTEGGDRTTTGSADGDTPFTVDPTPTVERGESGDASPPPDTAATGQASRGATAPEDDESPLTALAAAPTDESETVASERAEVAESLTAPRRGETRRIRRVESSTLDDESSRDETLLDGVPVDEQVTVEAAPPPNERSTETGDAESERTVATTADAVRALYDGPGDDGADDATPDATGDDAGPGDAPETADASTDLSAASATDFGFDDGSDGDGDGDGDRRLSERVADVLYADGDTPE